MHARNLFLSGAALALLAACAENPQERQLVPFDDWRGGHEIRVPGGVMARGCPDGDGQIVGIACFDPPIHPEGRITWLKIGGHDVPLADTRLNAGMLQTRDFGAVEIILPRTNRTEMLATPDQIEAIQEWLERKNSEMNAQGL